MTVLYKYMDAAAELGRNPVSKHHIQPEYGDEQADAGRDCRTRLARPNSQARTRTGKIFMLPVQLTTCKIGNLTRFIHILAICVTIHTHAVESPYGLLVERKCISLHKLQYCNVSCVLDYKPLLYKSRWHYYCILFLTYLIMYYNVFVLFMSGVPAWHFM